MLIASSKVASTLSGLAQLVTANSLALGDAAWCGNDLRQSTAKVGEGKPVVKPEEFQLHWMETQDAHTLVSCLGPEVKTADTDAALAVTGGLPETDTAVEVLRLAGNCSEILVQAALTGSEHIQPSSAVLNVSSAIQRLGRAWLRWWLLPIPFSWS